MVRTRRDLNLKSGSFRSGEEFVLEVSFVIKNLCLLDREKVENALQKRGSAWQIKKVRVTLAQMEEGKEPGDFEPIHLYLSEKPGSSWFGKDWELKLENGVSRLVAFKTRGVKLVRAVVRKDE